MSTVLRETRIGRRLGELRAAGRKGLIIYLCAGDPNLAATAELVPAVAAAGADVVELGIPFSDPLADGPVIQAAGQRALAAGTTPGAVLDLVAGLRAQGCTVPLACMTYYNLLLRRGLGPFCAAAAAAGLDGLIIPDLPHEEAGDLGAAARTAGLDLVPLVAPTSTPERVAAICRDAGGFIYCVSLTGVTGARSSIGDRWGALVAEVRRHTGLPVAVGFGINTPEQARRVAAVADAVVVGSAVVQFGARGLSRPELVRQVCDCVAALRAALL